MFSLLNLLSGGVWLPGSSDAVSRHVVSEMSLPVKEDPAVGGGQPSGAGSQAEHLNDSLGNLQIKQISNV